MGNLHEVFFFICCRLCKNMGLDEKDVMSMLILTRADTGKSFRAHQDEVILLSLPENPTTGYRWAICEINEELLELTDADFTLVSDGGIGAGGERRFRFKVKSTGTSNVGLKLQRIWEREVPAIQRYDFTIHSA